MVYRVVGKHPIVFRGRRYSPGDEFTGPAGLEKAMPGQIKPVGEARSFRGYEDRRIRGYEDRSTGGSEA